MTAAEWLDTPEPQDLLAAVRALRPPGRLWGYVAHCLEGVGEAETAGLIARRAAGDADEHACRERRVVLEAQAHRRSGGAYSMGRTPVRLPPAAQRARAGHAALDPSPWAAAEGVTQATRHLLQRDQCAWLRCLFGNPFRPADFDSDWRTSAVVALATGLDEDRAFQHLPVLADALEDAGCDHADILAHCRGDGPHVRGCWVVDLVLGKG